MMLEMYAKLTVVITRSWEECKFICADFARGIDDCRDLFNGFREKAVNSMKNCVGTIGTLREIRLEDVRRKYRKLAMLSELIGGSPHIHS